MFLANGFVERQFEMTNIISQKLRFYNSINKLNCYDVTIT